MQQDAVNHAKISTRAPREGSDVDDGAPVQPPGISTRAPREGSDFAGSILRRVLTDFYPRSPRGERPASTL